MCPSATPSWRMLLPVTLVSRSRILLSLTTLQFSLHFKFSFTFYAALFLAAAHSSAPCLSLSVYGVHYYLTQQNIHGVSIGIGELAVTLQFQPVSPFSVPSLHLRSVSEHGKDHRRKHIFSQ